MNVKHRWQKNSQRVWIRFGSKTAIASASCAQLVKSVPNTVCTPTSDIYRSLVRPDFVQSTADLQREENPWLQILGYNDC